jgi:hypothetical protein
MDTTGFGSTNMRTRTSTMQRQLNSPDDEWVVLEPKVTLLEETQAAMQTSSRMYSTGRGGTRGGGLTAGGSGSSYASSLSALQSAMMDLAEALADPASSEAQLTQRLAAVRKARVAAKKEFEDAQKALMPYITIRQEAVLVDIGLMD